MLSKTKPFLILLLALVAFAYGIASERLGIFPHGTVDSLFGAGDSAPEAPAQKPPAQRQPPRQQGGRPRPPKREGGVVHDGAGARLDNRGTGWWHRDARAGDLTPEQAKGLAVVPYMQGTQPAGDVAYVTIHDPDSACQGLNLVLSGHAPMAFLTDMEGKVLHAWGHAFPMTWAGELYPSEGRLNTTYWRRVHLFPNGDLLAIYDGIGMIKIGVNSNVIWKYRGHPHHDLDVGPDGRIYTLTRKTKSEPKPRWLGNQIVEDFVTVLSPEGEELKKVSIVQALIDSPYGACLFRRPRHSDITHTNTIELLDGRHADRFPMLQEGRLLLSIRNIDMICVFDVERETVTWAMTDMWRYQHQPTVLDNGHILVFDNRGNYGKSRVLEFDPLTQEVVWSYNGTPEMPLSSWTLGSCARLPNGNTLITESEPGRAIEVLPDGEIVWEYMSPFRAGPDGELVASLFEVIRIEESFPRFVFNGGELDIPIK